MLDLEGVQEAIGSHFLKKSQYIYIVILLYSITTCEGLPNFLGPECTQRPTTSRNWTCEYRTLYRLLLQDNTVRQIITSKKSNHTTTRGDHMIPRWASHDPGWRSHNPRWRSHDPGEDHMNHTSKENLGLSGRTE